MGTQSLDFFEVALYVRFSWSKTLFCGGEGRTIAPGGFGPSVPLNLYLHYRLDRVKEETKDFGIVSPAVNTGNKPLRGRHSRERKQKNPPHYLATKIGHTRLGLRVIVFGGNYEQLYKH